MKVNFLGVTGFPAQGNQTIALLLELNAQKILFDCGASIISQLEAASCLMTDLDGIVVTHIHVDHASGIPLIFFAHLMERFYGRYTSGKSELTLAMEQLTFDKYIPVAQSGYPLFFGEKSPVKLTLTPLPNSENSSLSIRDCSITTYPVSHSVPTIACCAEWAGYKVCYLSDTRPIQGLDEVAKGADLLVCNVIGPSSSRDTAERLGFMTAGDAAEIAARAKVKNLALLHLLFYERDARQCLEEATTVFNGKILLPRNGESLHLAE